MAVSRALIINQLAALKDDANKTAILIDRFSAQLAEGLACQTSNWVEELAHLNTLWGSTAAKCWEEFRRPVLRVALRPLRHLGVGRRPAGR